MAALLPANGMVETSPFIAEHNQFWTAMFPDGLPLNTEISLGKLLVYPEPKTTKHVTPIMFNCAGMQMYDVRNIVEKFMACGFIAIFYFAYKYEPAPPPLPPRPTSASSAATTAEEGPSTPPRSTKPISPSAPKRKNRLTVEIPSKKILESLNQSSPKLGPKQALSFFA